MTLSEDHDQSEIREFQVVELSSEDGEQESFVILDELTINNQTYAIMALLDDVENIDSMEMDEKEVSDCYGEEGFFHLMRLHEDGESYEEVSDEEFKTIQPTLIQHLEKLSD